MNLKSFLKMIDQRYKSKQNGSAYIKKDHHKKKELSIEEINRREWRRKVKHPKDSPAKYWDIGRKQWHLKKGNRAERRSVRQELSKSDFRYWNKSSTWWEVSLCTGVHDDNGCIKESFEWNPPRDDWDRD